MKTIGTRHDTKEAQAYAQAAAKANTVTIALDEQERMALDEMAREAQCSPEDMAHSLVALMLTRYVTQKLQEQQEAARSRLAIVRR